MQTLLTLSGWIRGARRYQATSAPGALLDAIADKLFTLSVLITIVRGDNATWWQALIVGQHTLFDIVRKLPEGSQVELDVAEGKMHLSAGRSRFHLSTLPRDATSTFIRSVRAASGDPIDGLTSELGPMAEMANCR